MPLSIGVIVGVVVRHLRVCRLGIGIFSVKSFKVLGAELRKNADESFAGRVFEYLFLTKRRKLNKRSPTQLSHICWTTIYVSYQKHLQLEQLNQTRIKRLIHS